MKKNLDCPTLLKISNAFISCLADLNDSAGQLLTPTYTCVDYISTSWKGGREGGGRGERGV